MSALDMFPETKAAPIPAEDNNRRYTPRAFMEWIRAKFRDGRATRFGYRLDCYFPPGRQAYAKPGSNGVPVGSADFPSCLLVWRRS